MRRILAFILLLSHMNTSMLLPQVPMEDVFDEQGEQLDDINSVVELVMVKLGIDDHPDDEDDDTGQNFFVPHFEYVFELNLVNTDKDFSESSESHYFTDRGQEKLSKVPHDVLVPPPDIVG